MEVPAVIAQNSEPCLHAGNADMCTTAPLLDFWVHTQNIYIHKKKIALDSLSSIVDNGSTQIIWFGRNLQYCEKPTQTVCVQSTQVISVDKKVIEM